MAAMRHTDTRPYIRSHWRGSPVPSTLPAFHSFLFRPLNTVCMFTMSTMFSILHYLLPYVKSASTLWGIVSHSAGVAHGHPHGCEAINSAN